MTESTQTDEFQPDGHAVAKCRVVGLAMMVVGACWFFRFLPFCFVRLYFPLEKYFSSTRFEFVTKSVILLAGIGIIACSFQIFKRRRYWIALLAPLVCLSLFAFCSILLFYNDASDYCKNRDYLNDGYTHPYYHPMEGMIPTEEVRNIASCFADYTLRYCCDERNYPKIEIPIQMILLFLAPTTLIGLFGLYTLLTPSVRRSFVVPLAQRVKISAADEKTQRDYCWGLSRTYAVLMFLLLLAILPTTIMDFMEPDRHEYLMPPYNIHLNYAIAVGMMIGIFSYFTRRYYVFALLVPLAWIASSAYFQWQIAWEYSCISGCSHIWEYYFHLDPFYSMILIVLVSRLTFGGLGIWIWWKNWQSIKRSRGPKNGLKLS